jgi:hypothetical protein
VSDGLFAEPERLPHTLSEMYSVGDYRARKGRVPKYTKYAAKDWCQECFALQHENRHQLERTRQRASVRRSIPDGPDLLLCHSHHQLWLERET